MSGNNNYVVRPNMWGRAYLPRLRVGGLRVEDQIQTPNTTDLEAEVDQKVDGFESQQYPAYRVERGTIDLAINNPGDIVFEEPFSTEPFVGLTVMGEEANVWVVSMNSSQGQYTGCTIEAVDYAVDPPTVSYFVIGN